jgi:hypothetical protein
LFCDEGHQPKDLRVCKNQSNLIQKKNKVALMMAGCNDGNYLCAINTGIS